ncbi:MAG: hypothetical protein KDA88_02650 [Planctomycetaceae bacterium]|nr:hypothetical protein [Planctomycetaceae bacterium]MCB9951000.1 hypothetical protein [Planctomycetaceae bacterium]
MKHALVVVLFVVGFVGAVGMFRYGDSFVAYYELVNPEHNSGESQVYGSGILNMALSAMLLLATAAAISFRLFSGTINPKYNLFGRGAGVVLALGACCLFYAGFGTINRIRQMATFSVPPSAPSFDQFIQSTRQTLATGSGILIIATMLLLVLAILEWRANETHRPKRLWKILSVICLLPMFLAPILLCMMLLAVDEIAQTCALGHERLMRDYIVNQICIVLICVCCLYTSFFFVGLIQVVAYLIKAAPVQGEVRDSST